MGGNDIQIEHIGVVGERLKHQKVLIFIDDLNDHLVLDALAYKTDWLGCGRKIIVVIEDKHFLCKLYGSVYSLQITCLLVCHLYVGL